MLNEGNFYFVFCERYPNGIIISDLIQFFSSMSYEEWETCAYLEIPKDALGFVLEGLNATQNPPQLRLLS
jgi:hypothetical protein